MTTGYQRRLCSNCGEPLSFSESNPCDTCADALRFPPEGIAAASDRLEESQAITTPEAGRGDNDDC